jgi:bifunctional non-homologous end joining protein LigD
MRFISDEQRRAVFSRLNRFSVSNMAILDGSKRSNLVMLAKNVEDISDATTIDKNPSWGACLKYDGIRLMSVGVDGRFDLFNPRKGGDNLSVKFPDVSSEVESLFASHAPYIIEGEVVSRVHDKEDFHNVVSRVNMETGSNLDAFIDKHPVVYNVFDVLEIDGKDVKGLPYHKRREILSDIIGDGSDHIQLERCAVNDKLKFANDYIASGGEGVIFKNLNSAYESGKRTSDWLKYKIPEGETFVVYGFERGKGSNSNGVGSLLIGKFAGGGFVPKGKVGSGLSKVERKSLYDKYNEYGLDYITLPKDEWFGVEVKYMEEGAKGGLRQPTIERLREDVGIEALVGVSDV